MKATSGPGSGIDHPPSSAGTPEPAHARGLRALLASPAALAMAYAGFGLAWVLLSDQLLRAITTDIDTLSTLGEGKGIAFVLMTSGLFYLLAVQQRGANSPPSAGHAPPSHTGGLMWVFAALCAAIAVTSVVSYAGAARQAYGLRVNQLHREAEIKASLVQGWTARRMDEARGLAADATLRASLRRWRRLADEAATAQLRRQLQMLRATGHYSGALLLDEQGRLLIHTDENAAGNVAQTFAAAARAAAQQGQVMHSDFFAQPGDADSLRLDLFIPLPSTSGHTDAVLVLSTAPRRTLMAPLLEGAALGAPETLLVRPGAEGLLVLGLNGSDVPRTVAKGDPSPSLSNLTHPATLAGTVVAGLAHGPEATAAVAVPLPDSVWFVAAQVPASILQGEPAASGAATLSVANILAVLVAAAIVYAVLRRRERGVASRMAADLQDKERAWKIAEVIANCSTDLIFAKDLQGRYLFANRELCRVLGRSADELIGASFQSVFPVAQVRQLLEDDAAVLRADQPLNLETRLTTTQGDRIYACTKGRLVDSSGQVIGVYGVSSDITDRQHLQQRMRQWSAAFEDIRDGVIITDALGRIQSVNHAFSQITGYPAEEAVGATMRLLHSGRHGPAFYEQMWALLNQTGHWQGEIWNRRKNGEVYPEWLTIRAVRDDGGAVTHYVGVFTDVSRIKSSEAQADWLFHNDSLTRLPNRLQLQRELEQTLARARRRGARPALMVIDLDGFKTVNDSLGHPAGDELLVCVAERLQAKLRHKDFLGRLGGDEFLVIVENGADTEAVSALARELLALVAEPVALSCGRDAYLTASIGISRFPESGSPTAVELLRDADAAMHRAKELGRNRSCFYSGDIQALAMAKLEVEAALSRAIERHELLLHYQPKVDAHSGRIAGAEALLRWQRGGGIGLVPPGQFIPLAEQSSLILDIGAWVIDAACRQIRAWMDAGQPVVRIAVNVAARQFAAGDLDVVVAAALQRHQVPAQHLELELTEGMLMSNPEAGTAALHRLRELGVKVSLDDFGTGYSSLAYLHQFPIDTLKIDQSFVRRIGQEPDGAALVDAVIGLAHRLHLRVVAEGVETAEQRDHLRRQHCDELQGYFFGRPAPAEALQTLLTQAPG